MKQFFLTLCILFAAFPGFSRQMADESPLKGPVIQNESILRLGPGTNCLEKLAERLESLSLSPSVGIPATTEFTFLNTARRYVGQTTQFSAPLRLRDVILTGYRPKIPP
ncbi:MAG: hypothetical protein WCN88_04390 [Candidatus Falkowbacteria bacterium]